MHRRSFLGHSFVAAAALAVKPGASAQDAAQSGGSAPLKGRLKQSVSRWCYGRLSLDELCERAAAMGIKGIDLLDENDWAVPAKHGLVCAMCNGPGNIPRGWNRIEHHGDLIQRSEALLPKIADLGLPNMIVFSGNRAALSDADAIEHCVQGLSRITPTAERLGVTICMEFLNSRHDHIDYQFDHLDFGIEVCKRVGSPRLKLLYDLYHAQIMEGDIIQRIRDAKDFIGHYHTGGVPGRHEIDETQELNYRAVCKAIVETGFSGFLAHEFVPTRDPMTSLRQAVEICDA